MKKSKIISLLGLSAVALSLSACSNNASNSKSTSQTTSTATKDPMDVELAKSKSNAETVIKTLKKDKANFTAYLTFLPETQNSDYTDDEQTKALPSSKPTVTIEQYAKKHHFNKYQTDILSYLLGGGDERKPDFLIDPSRNNSDKDVNGKTFTRDTFAKYDNITDGYFTISNPKLEATKGDNGKIKYYDVEADVTTHGQTKDGIKVDQKILERGYSFTDKIHM